MTDFVEDNYSITYADDDTVQVADVLPDYSFVIIYPSMVETKLGTRLRDLQRPVMVLHSRMLDEMGMAAVGGGSVTGTTVSMVKSMHPLSVALVGHPDDQQGRGGHRLRHPNVRGRRHLRGAGQWCHRVRLRHGRRDGRRAPRRRAGCSSTATRRPS